MSNLLTGFQAQKKAEKTITNHSIHRLRILVVGMSMSLFISVTYVLCVLFDLWFPQFAMSAAWAPLLPGFIWISWTGFFIGLVETFAYGWYVALLFVPVYNFFAQRSKDTSDASPT